MENSAWQSGNGFYSSQALFSDAEHFFSKQTPNLPNFGMNFGTQNTQVTPVYSVYFDKRCNKDCRTVLRYSVGSLVQKIHPKQRGEGARGPRFLPFFTPFQTF